MLISRNVPFLCYCGGASTSVNCNNERNVGQERAMPHCGLFPHCCHPVQTEPAVFYIGVVVGCWAPLLRWGAGKEKGRCRSERVKSTCSIVFAVCPMVAGTLHSWHTRTVYCGVELGPSIYVG